MLKTCYIVSALVVLGHCATAPRVAAQSSDPFAGKHRDDDPFSQPAKVAGKPVALRFRVVDDGGQPIAGATVRASTIRGDARTGQDGTANWSTTQQELMAASQDKHNPLRFVPLRVPDLDAETARLGSTLRTPRAKK